MRVKIIWKKKQENSGGAACVRECFELKQTEIKGISEKNKRNFWKGDKFSCSKFEVLLELASNTTVHLLVAWNIYFLSKCCTVLYS